MYLWRKWLRRKFIVHIMEIRRDWGLYSINFGKCTSLKETTTNFSISQTTARASGHFDK